VAPKKKEDRITVAGIKLYPHIGTTPEEKATTQECEAFLTVWVDLQGAASLDDIDRSVDYSKIMETAQKTASACEYNLIETLAYRIARKVLVDFPVSRVRVRLRKRPASMRNSVDYVEVQVEESG
jgi:dihydroneopterin aldolase